MIYNMVYPFLKESAQRKCVFVDGCTTEAFEAVNFYTDMMPIEWGGTGPNASSTAYG